MADLLNSLKCDRITIIDPHSDVTPALVNNCQIISQGEIIAKSFLAQRIKEENWALVAPDAGAEKKIHQVAQNLMSDEFSPDIFCAGKVRETKTGKITATTFEGDVEGRKLLIVDDICDGGRTFIELAKVLQAQGAQEIYLYITHGIFSKGLEPLKPYFQQIYCYHTIHPMSLSFNGFLRVLSVAMEVEIVPLLSTS